VPTDSAAVAAAVKRASDAAFAGVVEELGRRSPHLKAQADLVESLRPSRYAVLSMWSGAHAAWAIALENYASGLGGPILFAPEPPAADLDRLGAILGQLEHLRSIDIVADARMQPTAEAEAAEAVRNLSMELGRLIGPQLQLLGELAPTFVGLATLLALLPLELAGDPPLAHRFAVGRLSGPDLASTCEIIAWAALAEEVTRRPQLEALLLCASGGEATPALHSAGQEVEAARLALERISFVRAHALFDQLDDLPRAKADSKRADLLHFAGHAGRMAPGGPIALMLSGGPWAASDLPPLLEGHPIVFANACSSAQLESAPGEAARGLAAEFLRRGAVNYLGNLWPVVDIAAATMAGEFYRQLCAGRTVGEALLAARRLA
jgi:hypothetical protein